MDILKLKQGKLVFLGVLLSIFTACAMAATSACDKVCFDTCIKTKDPAVWGTECGCPQEAVDLNTQLLKNERCYGQCRQNCTLDMFTQPKKKKNYKSKDTTEDDCLGSCTCICNKGCTDTCETSLTKDKCLESCGCPKDPNVTKKLLKKSKDYFAAPLDPRTTEELAADYQGRLADAINKQSVEAETQEQKKVTKDYSKAEKSWDQYVNNANQSGLDPLAFCNTTCTQECFANTNSSTDELMTQCLMKKCGCYQYQLPKAPKNKSYKILLALNTMMLEDEATSTAGVTASDILASSLADDKVAAIVSDSKNVVDDTTKTAGESTTKAADEVLTTGQEILDSSKSNNTDKLSNNDTVAKSETEAVVTPKIEDALDHVSKNVTASETSTGPVTPSPVSASSADSVTANTTVAEPTPVVEPTPAPVVEPTPAPVVEPTPAPVVEPTPAPIVEPTPAPVVEPTPAPVVEPTPAPVVKPTPAPVVEPTPAPVVEPTPAPVVEPTPAPAVEPTPQPTPAPVPTPSVTPTPTTDTITTPSVAPPSPLAPTQPTVTPTAPLTPAAPVPPATPAAPIVEPTKPVVTPIVEPAKECNLTCFRECLNMNKYVPFIVIQQCIKFRCNCLVENSEERLLWLMQSMTSDGMIEASLMRDKSSAFAGLLLTLFILAIIGGCAFLLFKYLTEKDDHKDYMKFEEDMEYSHEPGYERIYDGFYN